MSLWTLQNTQVTGETQWTNASYNVPIIIGIGGTVPTQFLQVAGYTSGTISFTIDSPPVGWGSAQPLQISILGGIQNTTPTTIPPVPVSIFTVQTLELYNGSGGDSNLTTFYIEWNIPIEFVALSIFNNTPAERTLTNIRLLTESQGGGIGFTSSSGATVGPGVPVYSLQFNNTGVFGGASGALYDATANTNTGQVHLANGSASEPMLAFSDGSHPAGNYDTGIYRAAVNALGFSGNSLEQATIYPLGGAIPLGFNAGLNIGTTTNVTGIQRLSLTASNSWEDGNCGNSQFIVFTACDFAGAFTNPGTVARAAQTFVTWSLASAGRSPVVYNALAPGPALACKLIPKGFIIDSGPGTNCFIYSDIVTGGVAPQEMNIDVRVQTMAGPNIDIPLLIAFQTINAGAVGWQTAGDGSVNRTNINIPGPVPPAATGTGFNTVNIYVEPMTAAMSQTTGGIVAFKVPIRRI